MKRMIITAIMMSSFLHASDDSLKLPIYDPMTKSNTEVRVNLRQIDHFTQCDFQTLMKKAFEEERRPYSITVFICMNITGNMEYSVADTRAFTQWIAANGKVEPITNRPIAVNSSLNFIIKPAKAGLDHRYEVLRPSIAHDPSSGQKRKREIAPEENKLFLEFLKKKQAEKELRRAKELAFLREHD